MRINLQFVRKNSKFIQINFNIRCENILITGDLTPKISNFKYTRALQNYTGNIIQIVCWLAPEQMNLKELNQQVAATSTQQTLKNKEKKEEDYIPYTIQCEIFR